MIDATHLTAHRTARTHSKKGYCVIARAKGGLNAKLHAVCDGKGRPLVLLLREGQVGDHKGAALIPPALSLVSELIGDRRCASNRFRATLLTRGITPCSPSTRGRKG